MSDVAIKFENISKQYRLGLVSTNTISHDLNRWWTVNIRGKEDPYLKIGETNDRSSKGNSDYVWALKEIDFEVKQGDVLGIIGKNGAGKSTLLKILSKVTEPSTGIISARGRIASLLEVGTGFHPEMTGRENIYMNGSIMGMRKAEITGKLDEIVDFAGIERYLDTPVKRYSSGMTVRLGFAIAAHLEPEILVVDEVLAVGDAEFQKKAIGKMQDVSKSEGRTVLFVSHNMDAVSSLCTSGLLLKNGKISKLGSIEDVIESYIQNNVSNSASYFESIVDEKEVQILNVKLLNSKSEICDTFNLGEKVFVEIRLKNESKERGKRLNIGLLDVLDNLIMVDRLSLQNKDEIIYRGSISCDNLLPGRFNISLSIDIFGYKIFDILDSCLSFEIIGSKNDATENGDSKNGIIPSLIDWENAKE